MAKYTYLPTYSVILVGAHRFGVPFPKLQSFSEIFCALHIDYSQYEKPILGIFVYLFIYVTTAKVNFRFIRIFIFEYNKLFLCKMLVSFFSTNITLYIGKNPVGKLCKVLEMNLKCTPRST